MLTPEAIEAAAADLFERTALPMRRCREVSETALAAALPHLLADYREGLAKAIGRRIREIGDRCDPNAQRLGDQVNGLNLALSYLDGMLRS